MADADEPTRRWVLLGASNMTRGLATAVSIAREAHRAPLDIMAAIGNGRSYGWYARVLGRGLPGIIHCGLWRDLEARGRLPTSALLTDVGNDVMYGAKVDDILEWVEICLTRLTKYDAEIVMTGLPVVNLPRLGPIRYGIFRRLFFPGNRDTLEYMSERCRAVNEGVRRLAERYGAAFIEPRGEWYGLDPIHYRSTVWRAAWREILLRDGVASTQAMTQAVSQAATQAESQSETRPASSNDDSKTKNVSSLDRSFGTWLRTQLWMPEERWVFGVAQRRAQPNVVLDDATRISLY